MQKPTRCGVSNNPVHQAIFLEFRVSGPAPSPMNTPLVSDLICMMANDKIRSCDAMERSQLTMRRIAENSHNGETMLYGSYAKWQGPAVHVYRILVVAVTSSSSSLSVPVGIRLMPKGLLAVVTK